MLTQDQKGAAFAELHQRPGTFIIPNPWDAGTARLLAHLGLKHLPPPARCASTARLLLRKMQRPTGN